MKAYMRRFVLIALALASLAGATLSFVAGTAKQALADGGCLASYDPPEPIVRTDGVRVMIVRGYAYCTHRMDNVTLIVKIYGNGVQIDSRTYQCGSADQCVGHAAAPIIGANNLISWHGSAKVTWTHPPDNLNTLQHAVGGLGVNCQYYYWKAR